MIMRTIDQEIRGSEDEREGRWRKNNNNKKMDESDAINFLIF